MNQLARDYSDKQVHYNSYTWASTSGSDSDGQGVRVDLWFVERCLAVIGAIIAVLACLE